MDAVTETEGPDMDAERIRLVVVDDDLRVVVADNGCGFDPDRVTGHQLGLRTDIRERMNTAAGCAAVIRSAPGRGTQIVLLWSPT